MTTRTTKTNILMRPKSPTKSNLYEQFRSWLRLLAAVTRVRQKFVLLLLLRSRFLLSFLPFPEVAPLVLFFRRGGLTVMSVALVRSLTPICISGFLQLLEFLVLLVNCENNKCEKNAIPYKGSGASGLVRE